MEKATLKTSGKYAQIRRLRNRIALCAVDSQTESFVFIKKQENGGKNQISLHFPHGNECYSLKVDEHKHLELQKVSCNMLGNLNGHVFNTSMDFWFEKENRNASRDYRLRAARERLYLTLNGSSEFILSGEKTECVFTTHD